MLTKRDDDGAEHPTALDAIDALAKRHADLAGVSVERGYDAVLRTPEGARLYEEATAEETIAKAAVAKIEKRSALAKMVLGHDPYRKN